jgi:hypothetical protein
MTPEHLAIIIIIIICPGALMVPNRTIYWMIVNVQYISSVLASNISAKMIKNVQTDLVIKQH